MSGALEPSQVEGIDQACGSIFSWPWVLGLCIAWSLVWLASHCVLHPKSATAQAESTDESWSEAKAFHTRKLRRMMVYCAIASVVGLVLFARCFWSDYLPEMMLAAYGPVYQVFFTMAVGHWLVTLWEDWRTRHFLAQGLDGREGGGLALFPLNLCCTPAQVMHFMYVLHHVMTVCAYGFSLATGKLGGVMVQGMLFELPVIFMLRRELGVGSPKRPQWLLNPQAVNIHWCITYAAFAIGRLPAEALWILSMADGTAQEHLRAHFEQPPRFNAVAGEVLYHVLAVFFTSLNLRILGLLCCWHAQDLARANEAKVDMEPRLVPTEYDKE